MTRVAIRRSARWSNARKRSLLAYIASIDSAVASPVDVDVDVDDGAVHDPDVEAGHSCSAGVGPDDISNPSEQSDVHGRDTVDHECFVASVRAQEFNEWRNRFSVSMAKQQCRKVRRSYSCGIFSSGGLLCTISAIRSGFTPRWGTEIDGKMARMWTDLTGTPCLGDTFKQNFRRQPRVVYLKSGQPCPDFSSSDAGGLPPGSDGKTGWQFVAQVDQICALRPDAFCLEMVANSIRVNDGAEVTAVVESLSDGYHVHASVLRVASYGDCSNRQRLFIIGFNKETVGSVGTPCLGDTFKQNFRRQPRVVY